MPPTRLRIAARSARIAMLALVVYLAYCRTAGDDSRPKSGSYRQQYVNTLQSRLSLTNDQVSKLNEILEATSGSIRDRIRIDQTGAILDIHFEKVRAMLTGPQQLEYEAMLKSHVKRPVR